MNGGTNRGVLSSARRTHLNHLSSSWREISAYSRVRVMGESLHMESTEAAGVRKDFLDLTALVRSIQYAEGLSDCFRRSQGSCDQVDCTWRKYCLDER
jgi:hypothetical protein